MAHALRKWYERCVQVTQDTGWTQLLGGKCCFVLLQVNDDGSSSIHGLAGIHVDDFLLAGNLNSEHYLSREKALAEAFRWGKWEENEFEFAGCNIRQMEDKSVVLNQEKYSKRWLEEVEIDKEKARKTPLTS